MDNIVNYMVSCPHCKKVYMLDTFKFVKYKWDCNECERCGHWFSFDLMYYNEYVIAYNVVVGFYNEGWRT